MTSSLNGLSSRYKNQLFGWLSYAFASEVFVIVSLTLFLPICLEQFARDNGFLSPERTQPCSSKADGGQCEVKIGWVWIDTASFSLYINSISVALQALTVISIGSLADNPPHRKRLLLFFAYLGALSAILFLALPSASPIWLLCALLAIFANVGFGASVVAMNAYLPGLAKLAPEVVIVREEVHNVEDGIGGGRERGDEDEDEEDEGGVGGRGSQEPLLPPAPTSPSDEDPLNAGKDLYEITLSSAISRISSLGIALGYFAGIVLLVLALIPVTKLGGTTWSLRLAIGLSGIWWAFFSIPAAYYLPSTSSSSTTTTTPISIRKEIKAAWKRLGRMLRPTEIKRLRNTFKYLGAWFLLSDGFTTITSTAILFGKTSLHMTPPSLILIGILAPSFGIIGSLLWPLIQRKLGWSNLRVLVVLVGLASLMPAYGCLGFLPVFKKGGFGGLRRQEELFVLAAYFGVVYGAFQGYARAFYAELIPPGEEARWYALFSITDKSSSFLGPLIVGLIADTTGNIRYAFFFLVGMIWCAVPVLMSVDVERGRKDARGYRVGSE